MMPTVVRPARHAAPQRGIRATARGRTCQLRPTFAPFITFESWRLHGP